MASRFLYGATRRFLEEELPSRGVHTPLVDSRSGREWKEAIRPTTRVLYLEIPVNPKLRLAAADAFCRAFRVALVAPSLGGVETLVSQPRFTSHRGLTAGELKRLGIPSGYIRISVGIEDLEDLKADSQAGLTAAEEKVQI